MTILIEVFAAPGCAKCAQSRAALKAVVEALGAERFVWRERDVLREIDRAVALGVVSPPSLAIDGELVFAALPTPQRLRDELTRRLADAA